MIPRARGYASFIIATVFLLGPVAALPQPQVAPSGELIADWFREVVDSEGLVGSHPSIVSGASGDEFIAYRDFGVGDLLFGWGGPSNWQRALVDSEGDTGFFPSLTSDSNRTTASYARMDHDASSLRFAERIGDVWQSEDVYSGGVGGPSSQGIQKDGKRIISFNALSRGLLVATETDTAWNLTVANPAANPFRISLAQRAETYAIAYLNHTTSGETRAEITVGDGATWDSEEIARASGSGISAAYDASGVPHVLYGRDTSLIYGFKVGGRWSEEIVDVGVFPGDIVHYMSLAIGPDDKPRVAYFESTNQRLVYAIREDSGWSHSVVEKQPGRGIWVSLSIRSEGRPQLAYLDLGSDGLGGDLWYATPTFQASDPSPADLKHEAILAVKALKVEALERGDWRFVGSLDDAERAVLKSLGHTHPFRPAAIGVTPGADVSVARNRGDRVDVVLGPSWTARLVAYDALQLTWAGGEVTTVDLPDGWPRRPLRYDDDVWIDAWKQDLSISSSWDRMKRRVTLRIHAHDASLDSTLSLDADPVATLSFTYDIRPWWIDGSHLDPKNGHKVFQLERKAVDCLVTPARDGGDDDDDDDGDRDRGVGVLHGDDDGGENDACRDRDNHEDDDEEDERDDEGSSGHHGPHCRLTPALWTDAERAELDAECAAIANLLVAVDEQLSRFAVDDARGTAVKNPLNQGRVDREIGRAERALARAKEAWDRHEFGESIGHFGRAWEHAQRAMRIASG